MKNAKTRLTDKQLTDRNLKRLETDHMPESVATDLLCTRQRMTNRERKMLNQARVQIFVSTVEPKSVEARAKRKAAQANWGQLVKWQGRLPGKRERIQQIFVRTQDQLADPKCLIPKSALMNMLVALDVAGKTLDAFRDAVDDQIDLMVKVTRGDESLPAIVRNGKTYEWLTDPFWDGDLRSGSRPVWVQTV